MSYYDSTINQFLNPEFLCVGSFELHARDAVNYFYSLGINRESSFCAGDGARGGLEVSEAEFLAFKTTDCNVE